MIRIGRSFEKQAELATFNKLKMNVIVCTATGNANELHSKIVINRMRTAIATARGRAIESGFSRIQERGVEVEMEETMRVAKSEHEECSVIVKGNAIEKALAQAR
jgi:hypothetical protein